MKSLLNNVRYYQPDARFYFYPNIFYGYLSRLFNLDPETAQIYLTNSSMPLENFSEFLKYLNQHYPKLNRQPLLNHLSRMGLLPYIREFCSHTPQVNITQASILATLHGHYPLIKYFLLKQQPDLFSTLIFVAFHSKQFDLVEKILRIKPPSSPLPAFNEACQQGHLFLVERILKYDPGLVKSQGYLLAYQTGQYHITNYLDVKVKSQCIDQDYVSPNDLLKSMALNQNRGLLEQTIREEPESDLNRKSFSCTYHLPKLLESFMQIIFCYYMMVIFMMIICICFDQPQSTVPSLSLNSTYQSIIPIPSGTMPTNPRLL